MANWKNARRNRVGWLFVEITPVCWGVGVDLVITKYFILEFSILCIHVGFERRRDYARMFN